jgi:N-acetylglucosaminyldiphosphoundecaprenol N-acetyl-beta-D-mannosaminyltransferase
MELGASRTPQLDESEPVTKDNSSYLALVSDSQDIAIGPSNGADISQKTYPVLDAAARRCSESFAQSYVHALEGSSNRQELSVNVPQHVAADAVADLYKRFRRAALESAARELQQQGRLSLSNAIYAAQLPASDAFNSQAKVSRPDSGASARLNQLSQIASPDSTLPAQLHSHGSAQSYNNNPNSFDPYLNRISQVEFLGFRFHRMSQTQALKTLLSLTKSDKAYRVYFANAHSIEVASRNSDFSVALKRSNLLLADGSGILLGSQLLGKPLTYNLNGTDLIPALFEAINSIPEKISVYFLGAKPGVASQAANNALAKYPGLEVVGVQDGYFPESDLPTVLSRIRAAKPDILLVAMGTPLQETWIDHHSSQLPGIICIGVGGLFDFMAECVPRAPQLIRHLGSEWIWRLLMEPRRLWQRYTIGNLVYLWVLLTFTLQQFFLQPLRAKTTEA